MVRVSGPASSRCWKSTRAHSAFGRVGSSGRAETSEVTDSQALEGFHLLCRTDGIIPALESSHAIYYASQLARELTQDQIILVCLSGRGDKDIDIVAKASGIEI